MKQPKGRRTALLAAVTVVSLLLSACVSPTIEARFRTVKLPVNISVSSTADETERDGMRLFVDKLVEYAPATLEIRLFYEEDPVASLKNGEADIIFVDSPVLEGYDSDFAIYSSPFYFRDYDHMSMTLNSPTFLDLTRDDYIESLGGRQLGALYGGTMMLLTRDNPIRAVKDMEEFDLAALPDRYTSQSLAGLFRSVEEYGDPLAAWESGDYNALEVNSAELEQVVDAGFEKAYLINTSHRIEVNWLFVSEAFYGELDDTLRAAVSEATAYAIAYVDDAKVASYQENYNILQNRGVRTARFVTENLRKSGKEQLSGSTDFFTLVDKSRYDAVSMIIR